MQIRAYIHTYIRPGVIAIVIVIVIVTITFFNVIVIVIVNLILKVIVIVTKVIVIQLLLYYLIISAVSVRCFYIVHIMIYTDILKMDNYVSFVSYYFMVRK